MRTPLAFAFLAAAVAVPALAQPSAVHKTTLQTQAFPGPVYHTVTVRTVVDHGGEVAPHTHPGAEMAYVVGGIAKVKIAGHPDVRLTGGGSFSVPAATVHSVRNVGAGALIIVSTYVVDRNKPIASPAH